MEMAKQMVRDSIARETLRLEIVVAEKEKVDHRNSVQYTGIAIALLILISWWFFASKLNLPEWVVELSLYVPFLVFFRFITIVTSPISKKYTGDEPMNLLLFSIVLASIITPAHRFFEKLVRRRLFVKKEIG